ncbi:hypothetical protein [Hymenobacter sp. YC55]|uniref:hypothetical protein n=1 Tax=Hymenobacter sp. YC55 TaxID=3034019 RepID=UPI0023F76640|nr:hypothetical protein [Hymenobacter sp. YC55]MDF7813970.1 hypothetical protein [Hymenobacter sp. YC55]
MMQRGSGKQLTFEQVSQLRPGEKLLQTDDSLRGVCKFSVVSVSQITVDSDGGRQVNLVGTVEEEGSAVELSLSEKHYAQGPRLYRQQPAAKERGEVPTEPIGDVSPRPTLGELDIPSDLDTGFLAGELLAVTNWVRVLVHPGFLNDIRMNYHLGNWMICDAEHLEFEAFAPELAAGQFADLRGEPLRVLVAGYAHKAYQVLEPRYPGFTQRLVAQLFPEPVPVVPPPRPQLFDVEPVLAAYGSSLGFDGSEPRLVFTAPAAPVTTPADWDLLLASLTLFAAQLDLTSWLKQVATCEPTRELPQILAALIRGDLHEPEWSGLLPRLLGSYRPQQRLRERLDGQPYPLGGLLTLFAEIYGAPHRLEDIYARRATMRIVRATLDQLPGSPTDRRTMRHTVLAGLMDGLDQLARTADKQQQTHASLIFAQYSLIALQLLPVPNNPAQAEAWLARLQSERHRCQWPGLIADKPLDASTVWAYTGYAGSTILSVRPFCEVVGTWYTEGRVTNQLWSSAWWSLEQMREAFRLLYALNQQQPLPAEDQRSTLALMLEHLISHYHKAIQNLNAMLQRTAHPGCRLSGWTNLTLASEQTTEENKFLIGEIILSAAVFNELRAHGYGEETVRHLGKLVASF